jgi:hypothetical protein
MGIYGSRSVGEGAKQKHNHVTIDFSSQATKNVAAHGDLAVELVPGLLGTVGKAVK